MAALEPAVAKKDSFDTGIHRGLGFFNVVAGLVEQGDGVRFPLMMDAGKVGGVLNVHAEIDDVEDHLQDRGDDAGAPGCASDEKISLGLILCRTQT